MLVEERKNQRGSEYIWTKKKTRIAGMASSVRESAGERKTVKRYTEQESALARNG